MYSFPLTKTLIEIFEHSYSYVEQQFSELAISTLFLSITTGLPFDGTHLLNVDLTVGEICLVISLNGHFLLTILM